MLSFILQRWASGPCDKAEGQTPWPNAPAAGRPRSSGREDTVRDRDCAPCGEGGAASEAGGGPFDVLSSDLLMHVLGAVDAASLATTVPLVCRAWQSASRHPGLWEARLDGPLLAALAAHGLVAPCPSSRRASPQPGGPDQQPQQQAQQLQYAALQGGAGAGERPPRVAGGHSLTRRMALPELQHAVYARNLLRNPEFSRAGNQDLSLIFRRSASAGGAGAGGAGASGAGRDIKRLLQNRLAWVPTENSEGLSWEPAPVGMPAHAPVPPAPLPFPSAQPQRVPARFRRLLAAGGGPGGCEAHAAGGGGAAGAAAAGQLHAAASCLVTGGAWSEVVQVVDLCEELTRRGLDGGAAAAALDAGLLLGLSLWVGAREEGASQFAVALILDDGAQELRSYGSFIRRPSSAHFFSRKLAAVPGQWRRWAYLTQVPAGARRAIVLLRGRDHAGGGGKGAHGAKFAAAELRFVHQAEAAAFGAEACLEQWSQRVLARGPI